MQLIDLTACRLTFHACLLLGNGHLYLYLRENQIFLLYIWQVCSFLGMLLGTQGQTINSEWFLQVSAWIPVHYYTTALVNGTIIVNSSSDYFSNFFFLTTAALFILKTIFQPLKGIAEFDHVSFSDCSYPSSRYYCLSCSSPWYQRLPALLLSYLHFIQGSMWATKGADWEERNMVAGEEEGVALQASGSRSQNMQAIPEIPFHTTTVHKQWKRWLLETCLVIALRTGQLLHGQKLAAL